MNYPIEITDADIKNEFGVDLADEFGDEFGAKRFIKAVHSYVYDQFIYLFSPSKGVKARLIERYKENLNETLYEMLLTQAEYLLANGEDIGLWNGANRTSGGNIELTAVSDVIEKALCPKLYNMALSSEPTLVYIGEE